MLKKLLIGISALAVIIGATTLINTKTAKATQAVQEYTYFCHRANAVNNPYQIKNFSKTYSEIDGEGNNDHSLHNEQAVTSEAQAQALKDNHEKWGDIIPPISAIGFAGLNWNAQTQAVYYNDCNYAGDTHEQTPADIKYTVECNEANSKVIVTVTNEGEKAGTVTVNDQEITLDGGQTETVEFTPGTHITFTIGDSEEAAYDKTPVCETGGMGGGSTPTPTPEVTLPGTAGENTATLLGGISIITVLGSVIAKKLITTLA